MARLQCASLARNRPTVDCAGGTATDITALNRRRGSLSHRGWAPGNINPVDTASAAAATGLSVIPKQLHVLHAHLSMQALVVPFAPALLAVEPCNCACISTGTPTSAKACTHYEAKYQSKDSNAIAATASILEMAQRHINAHPSVAPGAEDDPLRKAKHLLQRTVNSLHSTMEISDQQVSRPSPPPDLFSRQDCATYQYWLGSIDLPGPQCRPIQPQDMERLCGRSSDIPDRCGTRGGACRGRAP